MDHSRSRSSALVLLSVATVSLLACSLTGAVATPTTAPPSAGPTAMTSPSVSTGEASCLVGVWEAEDVQAFVGSILPPSVAQWGTPEFQSTSGSLRYTFAADGTASAQASQYAIHYAIRRGILSVPLDAQIDGSITGTYALTPPDQLDFRPSPGGQMTITATLAGAPLLNSPLGDLIPIFGGQSSGGAAGTYRCDASTFAYTPPISGAASILFKRAGP